MANLCIKTPSSASLVLIFQLLVLRPRPSGNSKLGILSGYLHKLGCQDSKVLDCANQLHTFQNSKDSTTRIVKVLLFENYSSVLLTTLRWRVSIKSFMKYA